MIIILRAFSMACVKFKPNFGLNSYFFYFAQSLFKTYSIRFSISNFILFKYYFFINLLLLFSTQLKPNRDTPKKNPQQLHQQNPATSVKKIQQIYKLSQQYYRKSSKPEQHQHIKAKSHTAPSPSPIRRRRRR
jgi:hypothetical protein